MPVPAAQSSPPIAAIARGAVALLSTQPLTWAMSLLSTMLVPRYLGDQGLGQYALAFGIAGTAGTIASLGVPTYLVRRVATQPSRTAAESGAALVLLTGVGLLLAVLVALVAPMFSPGLGASAALRIALGGMVIGAAQSVLFSVLIGQERHARFAWFNTAGIVVGTLAGIAVLAAGGGVIAYMAVGVVMSAVMLVVGWYAAGLRIGRASFAPAVWWRLARGGLPFLGLAVALYVRSQADVILVGVVLRAEAAGWLSAAYRIIGFTVFVPTLIMTPLLPALSRCADDKALFGQTARRSLLAVMVLTVPISVLISVLSPLIPDSLGWGPAFYNSIPLMAILAVQQPLVAANMVLVTALNALHQERRWLRVAVVGAVFNPALNLIAIPAAERWLHNGAIGAAFVEVATEAVMLAGTIVLLPRGMLNRNTFSMTARVVVAGACLAAAASASRAIALPLQAPLLIPAIASIAALVGAATFLLALLLLRVVGPAEVLASRQFVRRALLPQPLSR